MTYISNELIEKLSSGPSESTEASLRTIRDDVVQLLGGNYDVFLQGSYKNDTAICNINDIDIVAVRVANMPEDWESIFDDIVIRIHRYLHYQFAVSKGNKCVKLDISSKRVDIVPAVRTNEVANIFNEPIVVFDRAKNFLIRNYPKTHYANGCEKNKNTNQKYKKCVRLLKNLVSNHGIKNIAPSFNVECLIYNHNNSSFNNELIMSFYSIVCHISNGGNFDYNFPTVSGDRPVISDVGWKRNDFIQFKNFLSKNILYLSNAVNANNQTEANYNFRKFFGLR